MSEELELQSIFVNIPQSYLHKVTIQYLSFLFQRETKMTRQNHVRTSPPYWDQCSKANNAQIVDAKLLTDDTLSFWIEEYSVLRITLMSLPRSLRAKKIIFWIDINPSPVNKESYLQCWWQPIKLRYWIMDEKSIEYKQKEQ